MNDRPYDEVDPTLEARARSLLTAAAETVDVAPQPVPRPERRPEWPWLVAAVAAAIALVVLLPFLLGAPENPRPAPTPEPGEAVTVPQTYWMTEQQARQTLARAGLEAVVVDDPTCRQPSGRVTRSRPRAAAAVEAGATVRLWVARTPPTAFCAAPQEDLVALGLLDLARFGRTDLAFAPTVRVYVDGEQTAELTAGEARDATAWGEPSPLTRLVGFIGGVQHPADGSRGLTITAMQDGGGQYTCGAADPPRPLRGRASTVVSVETPADFRLACQWVRVYRDEGGRVDAVTASSLRLLGPGPREGETPGAAATGPSAVAKAFAAYARGGTAPAFAPRVQLLLGSASVATVSAAQAADPATWRLECPGGGYAERSCPVDALFALRRGEPYAVTGTVERESSACHQIVGQLPADLTTPEALGRAVSLSAVEPEMCGQNWEIQLWLDDQDRIRAANLVLGSP